MAAGLNQADFSDIAGATVHNNQRHTAAAGRELDGSIDKPVPRQQNDTSFSKADHHLGIAMLSPQKLQ